MLSAFTKLENTYSSPGIYENPMNDVLACILGQGSLGWYDLYIRPSGVRVNVSGHVSHFQFLLHQQFLIFGPTLSRCGKLCSTAALCSVPQRKSMGPPSDSAAKRL